MAEGDLGAVFEELGCWFVLGGEGGGVECEDCVVVLGVEGGYYREEFCGVLGMRISLLRVYLPDSPEKGSMVGLLNVGVSKDVQNERRGRVEV